MLFNDVLAINPSLFQYTHPLNEHDDLLTFGRWFDGVVDEQLFVELFLELAEGMLSHALVVNHLLQLFLEHHLSLTN